MIDTMDPNRHTVSNSEKTPRWVKVFVAVGLVVVALLVVLLVFGGDHGPSRHGTAAYAAVR
jgi:hypothetical protein